MSPLGEYGRKRRFAVTPEPQPQEHPEEGESRRAGAAPSRRFVIQKHDATRLHYDLRLEHDGVLKSWALPKGLAVPHDERKLAVHVEDHPLEYLEFAGTIPKGEYGAGTVEIWDHGTYEPLEEPGAALEEGKLSFRLHGERVSGEFTLVRLKAPPAGAVVPKERRSAGGHDWLILLHKTGRLNPDLKTAGRAAVMPKSAAPMQAVIGRQPFSSPDYIYEIKFDGIRAVSFVSGDGSLRILSRNGKEQLARFPELAGLASCFLADEVVVDGEIVAQDEFGVSRFQLLQGRLNLTGAGAIERAAGNTPVYYYIFDVLYLNGRDLTGLPLWERKQILSRIFMPQVRVRQTEWIEREGEAFYSVAAQNGLEGIMAKRRESLYLQRRSRDWIKLKAVNQQEFVIGGYTRPRRSRSGFGALLVGYYDDAGDLIYAGHVGTGFSESMLADLYGTLQKLETGECPFSVEPKTNEPATWVRPELVAEVKFSEWTREGNLRQPVFLGLRTDKDARSVRREQAGVVEGEEADISGTGKKRGARTRDRAKQPAPAQPAAPRSEQAPAAPGHPKVYPAMPPPLGEKQVVSVGGRHLTLSNLRKPFWPEQGYTKYDLIDYYHRVAEFILPHLRGRPLTLKRYPDGYGSQPFFQKEAPPETPKWVHTEAIPTDSTRGETRFIICDDLPTLYFVVNTACISQNPWLSVFPDLDRPDVIVLDLDPIKPEYFDACVEVALLVRGVLTQFGLKGYPKTSGATGIHVYVPIRPVYTYEQARQFAQIVAWLCHQERPDIITLEPSLARRTGKVYLDFLQNVKGKTVASVYSVRSQAGAPVSTPLAWDELVPGRIKPVDFNLKNVPDRLEETGDLFAPVLSEPQDLMLALAQGEKFLRAG